MNEDLYGRALERLHVALSDGNAEFRDGQWDAIESLVARRERLLLVQRTWVGEERRPFIATSLLRDAGSGPTLIVSPLLALMRNQLEAAERLGLCAERIDSSSQNDEGEWDRVFDLLDRNAVDVLLVSPERLVNAEFQNRAGATLFARLSMLVVDEAHCISDWGHDFRPHYRHIANFVRSLPENVPMLATNRDRGRTRHRRCAGAARAHTPQPRPARARIALSRHTGRNVVGERLAWLAAAIPTFPRSGIVYTLTQRDANIVARWLRDQGSRRCRTTAISTTTNARNAYSNFSMTTSKY